MLRTDWIASSARRALRRAAASSMVFASQTVQVTINNGVGTVGPTGTRSVSPTATTTYVITATNSNGSVTAQTTVTVSATAPTITSFTANPTTSPQPGAAVTLTCLANNATSITIDQGTGALAGSKDWRDVFDLGTRTKPGDAVEIKVKRDGKDVLLKATLGSRPKGN